MERDLSLALAQTQAHLDLVASRFDILSDLGDLKEVKRLEADCRRTIRELAATERVPADPLADLESELVQLCGWAEEVTSLRAEAEELLEDDQLFNVLSGEEYRWALAKKSQIVGSKAPDFTLKSKTADGLVDVKLSANFGQKQTVVLFFPLAHTGVCTQEMCDQTNGLGDYEKLGAAVYAISVDSPFTQEAWAQTNKIGITLLSDLNKETTKAYGVLFPMLAGIGDTSARAAFVIGKDGVVKYAEQTATPKDLPNFAAVKAALASKNYGGRIGTDEIKLQLEATRAFLRALAHRCETLAARCPRNCFVGTRVDPRVDSIWPLRVAGRTRGWDGLGDKLPDVAHLRAWVEAPSGKASKERSTLTTRLEERVALLERWQPASVAEGDELAEAKRQLERGHPRAARTLQDRASAERFSHPLWKTLAERESAFLKSIEQVRQAPNSKKALLLARLVRDEANWAKVESDSEFGRELEFLEKKFLRSRRTKLIGLAAGITVLLIAAPFVISAYEFASERAAAEEKLRVKIAAAEEKRRVDEEKRRVERVAAEEKLRVEETRRTNISNVEKQQAELIEAMRSTSDLKVRLSPFFTKRDLLLADGRMLEAAAQARAIVVLRKLNEIILRNQLPIPKFTEENPLKVMKWRKELRLLDYHLGRIELRVEKGTNSGKEWDEISFSTLPKELTGAVGPDIVRDLKEHIADELRLKEIEAELRSVSRDMKPVFQVWSNEKNIQNKDLDKTLEDHEILVNKLADVAKELAKLRAEAAAP